MLVGSGSEIWIYRSKDLDLKEILTGADPDRAFHFDVDPDMASQNDAEPDPQHYLWHCIELLSDTRSWWSITLDAILRCTGTLFVSLLFLDMWTN